MKKTNKKTTLSSITSKFFSLKKWQRIALYAVTVLLAIILLGKVIDYLYPEVKNPNYGVSFSVKYAKELDLDWKEAYVALLDDMEIKNFRLMSYWDTIERKEGKYTFADLDWQMEEAAKRDATISLALGLRQPRWPECHKPKWFSKLTYDQQKQKLYEFLTVVVNRYKDHPSLISYQLENEAVNNWFGKCTDHDRDKDRLTKELELVKSVDPNHPVWMSLSDQHGLPLGEPTPDKYGFSVYRVVWNSNTGPFKFYLTYPTPLWYHHARADIIGLIKNRDIFIHELQLEPWGPKPTVDLSIEEQNKSMSLRQIENNLKFARKIGEKDMYLWGGEWWYWRKEKLNDPSVWNAVQAELNRN
jgi:hypothetical protein